MELVFILLMVCTIVVSFKFVNCQGCANGKNCNKMNQTNFEKRLIHQYDEVARTIVKAWLKCNETFVIPFEDGIDLFQNPPWGEERIASYEAKCLVDCTLRETGVMSDNGFSMKKYYTQIKHLSLNYENLKLNKAQLRVLDEMYKKLMRFSNNCYFMGDPNKQSDSNPVQLRRSVCQNLVQAYEKSALVCKDVQDPDDDT
ncbi:hypothetical protein Bhyg_16574 [Pseudolycoriella hygida]|uniref:Uncharacterized protein n=1 Tax=Pseudolycoriella hygida TaxID=35572 RepID=A0A9Q0MIS4_9DIPT|nr:hypothetical protein Bhyg_16574 [Pseudolycoriella hygida]